jgi:hypothetical protein
VNKVDVQTAAGAARNFAPLLGDSINRLRGRCLLQKRDMLNKMYQNLNSAFEASSTTASKWSDICVRDDTFRRRNANGVMCTAEKEVGAAAHVEVALVSSHEDDAFRAARIQSTRSLINDESRYDVFFTGHQDARPNSGPVGSCAAEAR